MDDAPHAVEEPHPEHVSEAVRVDNHTGHEERPAETKEEQIIKEEEHSGPHITVEEDGGRFNKNKDNQPSFRAPEEMQRGPQDTLESPLDMGLGVETEHSPSGW